jgi:hypothetical protein
MTNIEKIDKIGRVAAILSSIFLSALLFNLWVLSATAVEEPVVPKQQPVSFMMPEEQKESWIEKIYDVVIQKGTAAAAIPAREFEKELVSGSRFGKPVAYVNIDKLYLITKSGKIVGAADSCEHYDVPIISSDSFLINNEGTHLVDSGTTNALQLLSEIQKNYAVKSMLSELKIKDDNIIAYMNLGKVLPVIFGQGDWNEKINNFISFQKQLGASDLVRKALYLDLCVENKIIVKKKV